MKGLRMKKAVLIIFLFLLSSCALHRLDIQTQYLTPEYLASFHIGTPDPKLYAPFIGERLLIQWSLPSNEICDELPTLFLKVRYKNHQEEEIKLTIRSSTGTTLFKVEGEKYCQTGGILTYYSQIEKCNAVLATWKHPLWRELIKINY